MVWTCGFWSQTQPHNIRPWKRGTVKCPLLFVNTMHNLTKKTYFAYALQTYDNPSCSGLDEFREDLLRIKYIKRLIHRYARTGDVSTRLLLNHIIGIYNVFQPSGIARMLFFRIDKNAWSALKTVLEYLNLMPETVLPIDGYTILNTNIPRDERLWRILRTTVEGYV